MPHYDFKTYWRLNDKFIKGMFCFENNRVDYYIDVHHHSAGVKTEKEFKMNIDDHFNALTGLYVRKVGMIFWPDQWNKYRKLIKQDKRLISYVWVPDKENFNVKFLSKVIKEGAQGIKLHTRTFCRNKKYPLSIFEEKESQKFYGLCAEAGLAILWHSIHGLYNWEKALVKPLDYTRQDILDAQIRICKKHPKLKLIGAHMNCMSEERLAEVMDKVPNFYVDTSVKTMLFEGEQIPDKKRKRMKEIFTRHCDQFLWATDNAPHIYRPPTNSNEFTRNLRGFHWVQCATELHQRFFKVLDLSKEVSNMIAHGNAERLFGLEPLTGKA